jgi:hypothetical protein
MSDELKQKVEQKTVTEVYVFLMIDREQDPGHEGFCGVVLDEKRGLVAPILARGKEATDRYFPFLQQIANQSGNPIHLVKFTARETVETIAPAVPVGTEPAEELPAAEGADPERDDPCGEYSQDVDLPDEFVEGVRQELRKDAD